MLASTGPEQYAGLSTYRASPGIYAIFDKLFYNRAKVNNDLAGLDLMDLKVRVSLAAPYVKTDTVVWERERTVRPSICLIVAIRRLPQNRFPETQPAVQYIIDVDAELGMLWRGR